MAIFQFQPGVAWEQVCRWNSHRNASAVERLHFANIPASGVQRLHDGQLHRRDEPARHERLFGTRKRHSSRKHVDRKGRRSTFRTIPFWVFRPGRTADPAFCLKTKRQVSLYLSDVEKNWTSSFLLQSDVELSIGPHGCSLLFASYTLSCKYSGEANLQSTKLLVVQIRFRQARSNALSRIVRRSYTWSVEEQRFDT